jgi:hypothetical protein
MNQPGPIFLSASVPYRRPERYRAEPLVIREAIRALVAVVVPDRVLVFGGHPAISPMVWDMANNLKAADHVYIYQSEKYEKFIPKEAGYFENLVWTAGVPKDPPTAPGDPDGPFDRDQSLTRMRKEMIESRPLDPSEGKPYPPYVAGFFIGGMEGVDGEEWTLFRRAYPRTPAYPVASTEGAARHLWYRVFEGTGEGFNREIDTGLDRRVMENRDRLDAELRYRVLFRDLLNPRAPAVGFNWRRLFGGR